MDFRKRPTVDHAALSTPNSMTKDISMAKTTPPPMVAFFAQKGSFEINNRCLVAHMALNQQLLPISTHGIVSYPAES